MRGIEWFENEPTKYQIKELERKYGFEIIIHDTTFADGKRAGQPVTYIRVKCHLTDFYALQRENLTNKTGKELLVFVEEQCVILSKDIEQYKKVNGHNEEKSK